MTIWFVLVSTRDTARILKLDVDGTSPVRISMPVTVHSYGFCSLHAGEPDSSQWTSELGPQKNRGQKPLRGPFVLGAAQGSMLHGPGARVDATREGGTSRIIALPFPVV